LISFWSRLLTIRRADSLSADVGLTPIGTTKFVDGYGVGDCTLSFTQGF